MQTFTHTHPLLLGILKGYVHFGFSGEKCIKAERKKMQGNCHSFNVDYHVRIKNDGYAAFIEAGMLEVICRAHEERGSYKMAIAFFEEKLQFSEKPKEQDSKSSASIVASEELATTLNSLGMQTS